MDKCPKCKIYTVHTAKITMHLAPDVLLVDMEQLKPRRVQNMLALIQ